jgi:hypothetical protein
MRETRRITSNTALSAGGSATITWDSSQPLQSSTYTRYHLIGTNKPQAQVDRLFNVREPASGAIGTATYVGAHLYPRFPKGAPWGNMTRSAGAVGLIFYPAAKVLWSSTGAYPWFEEPVAVQLNPVTGQIDLSQPAAFVSAGIAGQTQGLASAYPASFYQGKWYDVQVVVPYNRGSLSARWPATGFAGTAKTKYNIERTMVVPMDTFTFKGDLPSMQALAAQHLATVQDAAITGSILLHFDDWTPTFDPLTIGYSLNIALPPGSDPDEIAGLDLPVRSWTMEWHDSGALIRTIAFEFSNLHRPFQGDALYLHPAYAPTTWGVSEGNVFVAGNMGGYSGEMGMDAFNAAMTGQDLPGYDSADDLGDFDRGDGAAGGDEAMGEGDFGAEMPDAAPGGRRWESRGDRMRREESEKPRPPATPMSAAEALGYPDREARPRPATRKESRESQGRYTTMPIDPDAPLPANEPTPAPTPPAPPPQPPPPPPRRRTLAERRGFRDDDTTSGGG